MEKKLLLFYRSMLIIVRREYVNNDEVLEKIETKWTLLRSIKNRQWKFLKHIITKDSSENIALTCHLRGKKDTEKQRLTYLRGLCERIKIRRYS